jgi:hypothetical protein
MEHKTFELTPLQMLAIFDAGRRRGNEEATAWEWGSLPDRNQLAELENTLVWDDECGLTKGKECPTTIPGQNMAEQHRIRQRFPDVKL